MSLKYINEIGTEKNLETKAHGAVIMAAGIVNFSSQYQKFSLVTR